MSFREELEETKIVLNYARRRKGELQKGLRKIQLGMLADPSRHAEFFPLLQKMGVEMKGFDSMIKITQAILDEFEKPATLADMGIPDMEGPARTPLHHDNIRPLKNHPLCGLPRAFCPCCGPVAYLRKDGLPGLVDPEGNEYPCPHTETHVGPIETIVEGDLVKCATCLAVLGRWNQFGKA